MVNNETLGAAIGIIKRMGGGGESARIDAIEEKIPASASANNKLADKAYVDTSINTSSAFFKGAFETYAALTAVAWQSDDPTAEHYVSNNDFAYIESDETHANESWRYAYVLDGQDDGWHAQYRINEAYTQEQIDAINSGVTADKVSEIGTIAEEFSQNKPYSAGDYVFHGGKLYKFDIDHAAGDWAILQVTEVNVMEEIIANGISEDTEIILHTLSAEEMLAENEN